MRNTVFIFLVAFSFAAISAFAVAPTEEAIAKFKADGTWEKVMANLAAFKAAGGCQPVLDNYLTSPKHTLRMAADAQVVETLLVPVILVDFPDFHYHDLSYPIPGGGTLQAPAIGTPHAFDSILFSRKGQPGSNPTGSMTDYYLENSYGKFVITGQVYGWYTAPQNYSYYVGTNSGLGPNGAELARDAVVAAQNALVDFTPYDNDNNGSIDAVIVIHAGQGAEIGVYGIWSHRWNMASPVYLPNGKYAFDYTMNPEEYGSSVHPIGIFCHEYGHILGLPDLYDTDKSHTLSQGLGEWSLMAYGNYNGDSKSPAHFDPWCKIRLGFISPTEHVLTPPTNLYQTPIPQVESEPFAYKVTSYMGSPEYFLIENRQLYGFDTSLPGEGLLVYHVDENQYGNADPAHYMVALEQADGFNSIAFGGSQGDWGDPFPGSTGNRNFYDLSVPNSRTYAGASTQIAAWRISNSGSTMYADLDTRWSRPWVVLSGPDSIHFTDPIPDGDGDGVLEAGETISFTFGVKNLMRSAYGSTATLSCSDPDLTFMNNAVGLSDSLSPTSAIPVGPVAPIKFALPSDWQTHIVQFTLRLVMDSILNGGDATWNTSFTFSQALGRTQIMLVDDDNGKTYETRLGGPLTNFGLPYAVWNVKNGGAPLLSDVQSYKSLFWFTGNETGGGAIDAAKIATLKAFIDGGGNVCLASVKAPAQISAIDTGFMSQYLHAQNGGLTPVDSVVAVYDGVAGNDVSNGIAVGVGSVPVTYVNTILIPVNGGQPAFTFQNEWGTGNMGNGGVTFAGSYRSVFLSFAMEFLAPSPYPVLLQSVDTLMRRIVNFLQPVGYSEPRVISVKIDGKIANAHVLSSSPVLSWFSRFSTGMTQQMFEIAVGSDSDWLYAEMWNPPPFSSSDSSANYSGATLLDGHVYYLRLRISDGNFWSSWLNGSFRLNTAPSLPILLSPADGAAVENNPKATVTNSSDPENDLLTYDFQIYSDSLLTTMIRTVVAVPATPSETGWNVVPALPDNQRFWWRARAFDGYEYSGWSGAHSFSVNGPNVAPTAPVLIDPPDSLGLPLFDLKPTLRWTASTDPDPFDTVHYKLELSRNAGFTLAVLIEPIPTNQYTLADSLAWGTHYWWRVRAIDRTGLFTLCPNPKNFWTWELGDVDHSHNTDIADLVKLVDYLYISFTPITPIKVADLDGDCHVDISDLTKLVDRLYITFTPLGVGCGP